MAQFLDPKNIIKVCEPSPDAHIADFGTGSGIYSFLLAEGAPMRKIFAIDIQKDLIDRLSQEAERRGFHNLHAVWGDIDELKGSMLRNDSIDCVLMINTLFQLEKPSLSLQEANRILKKGGKLLLSDWSESFGHLGPHPDHVISKEEARKLIEKNGFSIEKEIDDAGEHHYVFIARKD